MKKLNEQEILAVNCKYLGHHTKIGLKRILLDVQYNANDIKPRITARQLWLKGITFFPRKFTKFHHLIYIRDLGFTGYNNIADYGDINGLTRTFQKGFENTCHKKGRYRHNYKIPPNRRTKTNNYRSRNLPKKRSPLL